MSLSSAQKSNSQASNSNFGLTHPKYRADIDGLRAIAVLSVVFFHAFPFWMKGGFIGVDIFFIISGYLISTIIFENLQTNNFSFFKFYARRIQRIFPALILVLIVSFCLGWSTLLVAEFNQLGKHIVGGAGFFSNFLLWKESGYFDTISDTKPLLHLWSLGIEEQFYIVWPLIVWCAWKKKINWLTIIVVISIISFSLNLRGMKVNSVATFYSPQTRFWELLTGSLLAHITLYKNNILTSLGKKLDILFGNIIYQDAPEENGKTLRNVSAFAGCIFIVAGLVLINKERNFPGTWALLPTLGATLIIAAGAHAWFNRTILSNKIIVWFGLISFPLYLWHWVLLSFARIVEGDTPARKTRIAMVMLSIALAWITYKFIEKPIRFGKAKKYTTVILLLLMVFIGGIGYAVDKNVISPRSKNLKILDYLAFGGYPTPEGEYIDEKYGFGTIGNNQKDKILLLGDSHAEQYRITLANLHKYESSIGKNPPSIIYNMAYLDTDGLLRESNKVLTDKAVSAVIFSKYWAANYGSDKINYAIRCCGNGAGGSVGGSAHHEPMSVEQMNEIDKKLENTVSALIKAGKKVYFVLDNAFGEELSPQQLVSRSIFNGVHIEFRPLLKAQSLERNEPGRTRLITIAKKTGAGIIDPYDSLCDKELCPALAADGNAINKDYDHLSVYTVTHLVHYLDFLVSGEMGNQSNENVRH